MKIWTIIFIIIVGLSVSTSTQIIEALPRNALPPGQGTPQGQGPPPGDIELHTMARMINHGGLFYNRRIL